jgi:hypothetical protein
MENKKSEKRVIFRRIRGHIVPITVGAGIIGATKAITLPSVQKKISKAIGQYQANVAMGANRQRLMHKFAGNDAYMRLNSRVDRQLSEIVYRRGGSYIGGGQGRFNAVVPKSTSPLSSGYFAHFKQRHGILGIPKIETNLRNTPIILHEMGHFEQNATGSMFRSKFMNKVRDINNSAATKRLNLLIKGNNPPWIDSTYFKHPKIQTKLHEVKHSIKYYGAKVRAETTNKVLRPFLDINRFGLEMEANAKAINFARLERGPHFAKITAKAMIPNVLGYGRSMLGPHIKNAALITGAGLIGYGAYKMLKRDENGKK